MKHLKLMFSLILLSTSTLFGQWNEQLWDCYLTETQLSSNKVKLIIIEGGDIINHHIRPDGKIQQTIIASSNKAIIGDDKYFYYRDTLIDFKGYRNDNIYIYKNFFYEDGFLNNEEIFQNDYLSMKYKYSTYPNGWKSFIGKYRIDGYYEQELWTKKINYYVNGFIKEIHSHRGLRNQSSYYVYNKETSFIEKEIIRSAVDNKIQEDLEIRISTYDNGLTKSIISDGYTQKISYQYYSIAEFEAISDTLNLIEDRFQKFEEITAELVLKLKPKYPYIPYEINSINSNYKQQMKREFENKNKLLVLVDGIDEISKYNNLEEKELKKMNREIKIKYGL